jgi:DNA replicative helicase MCM subunit Mcm2 (Cdc46/Mcm family)
VTCFLPLPFSSQNFVKENFPAYIEEEHGKKEFFISFVNLPSVLKLRELKTEKIGSLCSFSATVTRTSEVSSFMTWICVHSTCDGCVTLRSVLQVRPELLYGAFSCMVCGTEVKDVEQQCKYTTPAICPNPTCNNRCAQFAVALFWGKECAGPTAKKNSQPFSLWECRVLHCFQRMLPAALQEELEALQRQ